MIQIVCPKCRERVRFDDDEAGQVVTCPECAKKLRLPARPTPQEPPDSSEDLAVTTRPARRKAADEEAEEEIDDRQPISQEDEEDEDAEPRSRRAKRKLGPVQAKFPVARKHLVVGYLVSGCVLATGLGAILFGIVASFSTKPVSDAILLVVVMTLIGGGILTGGIFLLRRYLRVRDMRVLLCRDGIAHIKHGVRKDYRWEDLAVQYQEVTEHYYNGAYTGTTHVYTMETVDGDKLVLSDEIKDVETLGDAIAAEITQRELPRVRADYDAGEVVYFDKIGVSSKGLHYGDERLPWRDIKGVRIKEGYVSVSKKGGWFNWRNIAAAKIPNLAVFLTLVDDVIRVNDG